MSEHLRETAYIGEQVCQLVNYHAPEPVVLEYHHQKPVYLQDRLYGKILFGPSLWVCANCHEAIHAWLYWLLGERKQPARIGYHAKAEAERTYSWYLAECNRLHLHNDTLPLGDLDD